MREIPQGTYQAREKRVLDAVRLRVPDRVPVLAGFGFFPAKYAGMTCRDVMYDPDKMASAEWKTIREFAPDMIQSPFGIRFLGTLLDALDFRQLRWPGHGIAPDSGYQFVEGEYMKVDEYDAFLFDPTGFILKKYLPRICGGLQGFEKLPSLSTFITYYMGLNSSIGAFTLPEVKDALNTLEMAGREAVRIGSYTRSFVEKAKDEGFPVVYGGMTQAPFDTLGDFFRGTKGIMLDMYRRPGKVIATCEKLLPIMLELAIGAAKASGVPRVYIPLHKGASGFMSQEQFNKFYWPTLRELIVSLVSEGITPFVFFEGDCTSRINTIKDVPEGRVCYSFESSDMTKVKEALGNTVCIRGYVPISILATGTPQDVKTYCKKLIDTVAKDGGFIMDASTGLDDAKPENIKAMFEFTKEYGLY